jgi:hypothetical protein
VVIKNLDYVMWRTKKSAVWLILFLAGCSDSDLSSPGGQDYFPLHLNYYWDYAVSETNILETVTCGNGGQTQTSYQLRMVVSDSMKGANGGYTFIIHRYTRPDESKSWTDLDTWTARVSANSVIQAEGNTSYVKFIFPLKENLKWNANIYNNLTAENYSLTNVGKAFQVSSSTYSKTITVVQSDYDDIFISRDNRSEVYAYNVGLIHKKIDQRTYFLDPCYGQQKVQKGLLFEQSLIGYGKL